MALGQFRISLDRFGSVKGYSKLIGQTGAVANNYRAIVGQQTANVSQSRLLSTSEGHFGSTTASRGHNRVAVDHFG